MFEDTGLIDWPITTDSEEAQSYFNQGLKLTYGFWRAEARRSFEEAIRRDPEAPMAHWGKALAYGPYLNGGNPPREDLKTAYDAITLARAPTSPRDIRTVRTCTTSSSAR